jgi:hypothetical protein
VEAIRQRLADTERLWLLVFDNVEDSNIAEYFPAGLRGDIIITGRDRWLRQYSTVGHEEVGAMDRDEAKALLFSCAYGRDSVIGEDMTDAVGDVVDLVDCMPLAIVQVAGFMMNGNLSPKDIVERFADIKGNTSEDYPLLKHLTERRGTDSEGYQTRSEVDTAKDSGYVSGPTLASSHGDAQTLTLSPMEEIHEGNDLQSIRSLATLVDLGEDHRIRGIGMFALNIVDSINPDISDATHDHNEARLTIQEALEAFSYSVERDDQFPQRSLERQASTFVRQQNV